MVAGMTLRVAIVDDEAPARRRIARLLSGEPDITVVGESADGDSALTLIARERPDLVFLDVQMPERDGFAVVRAIASRDLPAILFVTAHDRYALQAFDVHAVDYLLKPFSGERFRTALARARERVARRAPDRALADLAATLRTKSVYLSRIAVRAGGRTVVVDLTAVDWMEAADNYVRLHVREREFLVRDTLAALEAKLDPERFVRVHRSTIVAIDRVIEIAPATHGDATLRLKGGTTLAVSRRWRERLHKAVRPGARLT